MQNSLLCHIRINNKYINTQLLLHLYIKKKIKKNQTTSQLHVSMLIEVVTVYL